jgi:Kef-type K+ transport system membrane component KefB
MTLLMPFFFTLTGLQTFIDLTSPDFLAIFLMTTALAVGAKILGTAIAARVLTSRVHRSCSDDRSQGAGQIHSQSVPISNVKSASGTPTRQ